MIFSAFLLLNTVGAHGQPGPTAHGDTMQSGEVLKPNQQINSANGRYSFAYQSDSNLVLYKNNPGRPATPLWSSVTTGKSAGVLVMEGDGNLVIYDAGRQRVWSSNTANNPGSRLVVQNDGNVVIYRPDRTPIWSTNTANTYGDTIEPGVALKPSQRINSINGRYTFVYQSDGNLVLYKNNPGRPATPLWSSVTTGKSAGVLVMEGDGDLVIYDAGRQRVWSSNTANNPGSRLVVQNDGNVVIYRPDRTPIWSTNAANTHGDTIGPGVVLEPSPRAGRPASNTRFMRTCSAMPSASTWPTLIRTPARFSSISGKRIFSTLCDTRSCRRIGSRISGRTERRSRFFSQPEERHGIFLSESPGSEAQRSAYPEPSALPG
jgi:hypothetical protein